MIPDSVTLRSVRAAYLFPAQPLIEMSDGMEFYKGIVAAKVGVSEFSHQETALVLQGSRGGKPPHQLRVTVDHHGGKMRLHISEDFPDKSLEIFCQQADDVWENFLTIWDETKRGGPQVLSEVRLRVTGAAESGDARQYIGDKVMRVRHAGLGKLGRAIHGVGFTLIMPLQLGSEGQYPLNGSQVKLTVESLLEDPRRIYIEAVVSWPAVGVQEKGVEGMPTVVNTRARNPSTMVTEVYDYLTEYVVDFLTTLAD